MHVIPCLVCLQIVCSVYQTQIRHSNVLTPVPPLVPLLLSWVLDKVLHLFFTLIIRAQFINFEEFPKIVTHRSSMATCVPLTYKRTTELLEIESNRTDICEHVGNISLN